jgi:2-(1,2-epoxy-1,2-dihydrophenyl)acetyl-CoA isomerase
MAYETLLIDRQDRVLTITLNRPAQFNALSLNMCEELADIATAMSVDRSVGAIIITGQGDKAFCAGGDVGSFAADPERTPELVMRMTGALHSAVARFAGGHAPVIAAVNGVAAGGGLSLMAACDLAIAVDTARFTSAYTQIGLTPDGSSTYFLTRLLGPRRALEMFLTNRTLNAAEALDWGLVNQVVGRDVLMSTVHTLAAKLAAGPSLAHRGIKRLVQLGDNTPLETQMEYESQSIAEMARTQDGRAAVAAFVSKTKPVFTGQ